MSGASRKFARVLKDVAEMLEATEYSVRDAEISSLPHTMFVTIRGPKDSPYEDGVYTIKCNIPEGFPMKSPALSFLTPIWHPNIASETGAVCLDILKGAWLPVVRLHELFAQYIPQLLLYPEPSDPFNQEAAALMQSDPKLYAHITRKHALKHAVCPLETSAVAEE